MTGTHLALFHTADMHIETFGALLAAHAPDIPVEHHVRDDLLRDAAEAGGLTPAIRAEGHRDMTRLAAAGAPVVLCTCSTLGPAADDADRDTDAKILRVDRPMVAQALAAGPRLTVAACAPSTVAPTTDLVDTVAAETGTSPGVSVLLIEKAWDYFLRGDHSLYLDTIAEALTAAAAETDSIVLAQASMAPVTDRLGDLAVPVFSSPRSGTDATIDAYRRAAVMRR